MQDQLPSVHEALANAATEVKSEPVPMRTYTFRIGKTERIEAETICLRHGVTLAEFFRSCARQLSRDYKP